MAQSQKEEEGNIPPGITLRHTLQGHTGEINQIAWSLDGYQLASGSKDKTIRLWDVQTGQTLRTLKGHSETVHGLGWSPNGHMLASGSEDKTIRLWDVQTGQTLRTLKGHSGTFSSMAWSLEGILASGSGDGTISLWDTQAGQELRTLNEHSVVVKSVAWSPDARVLASGLSDKTIQLWDAQTGQMFRTLTGHSSVVLSVAWSLEGILASGSGDGTISLWDTQTGQQNSILEGHTDIITSVSFSYDGRFLASKSMDNTVRIWSVDTLVEVANFAEASTNYGILRLAFHPTAPILATPEGKRIHIWELDFDTLLKATPTTPSVHYTTAKIALVGDSSVGKTGLGYRLAEDRFQVTESTHGQQFWVVDKLGKIRGDGTQCEAVLWDFAGQPNFRPIHSLFLDDVDLALVLFDPTRPDTLAGVDYWLKQLSHNQQQYRTVLVAARTDVSLLSTSPAELEAFCRERNISGGFVATSAKLNEGIDTLLEVVRKQIDWDAKVTTVTTQTFKRIKDYVLDLKANTDRTNVLVSPARLRTQLEATDPEWQFSDAEMMAAVGHLQNHGYVTVLRRSSEEERILLAPDLLINLAASFILKAQANERGLGALDEARVLRNEYAFREVENLSDDERDTLLNAVTELFLKRNICFRESVDNQTFLIFPSLIFDRPARMTGEAETVESTVYVVKGQVQNVYPALVVLLGYSPSYQRTSQWRKQAQYETRRGDICGFKLANDDPGELELVLYYTKRTPDFARQRFQGLFEEILYTRNVSVKQYPPIFCPKCGRQQERRTIIRRIQQGETFLFCEHDGEKISLPPVVDRLQLSVEDSISVMREQNLSKLRTFYETALVRVKGLIRDRGDIKVPSCFISYAWGDPAHERWVVKLAEDLRKADIDVVLDQWDNPDIGSNIARFITRIATSDFIVVVGTPSYLKKYENMLSPHGNVVAAEVDLINNRLTGTESQKASVLPVLLQGDQFTSLTPLLQGRVYANFTNEEQYFTALFGLVLTIYRIAHNDPTIRDLRENLQAEADKNSMI